MPHNKNEINLAGATGSEVTNESKCVNTSQNEVLKTSSIWDIKPIGHVYVETEKPGGVIIRIVRNCLDSDLNPVRIKDGDYILIYEIPNTHQWIARNVDSGKIVCFILRDERAFTKQFVFYDCVKKALIVNMFNPQEEYFQIPINGIKSLFIVEKVLNAEYVRQYSIPNK